jgi:hypothetical protein
MPLISGPIGTLLVAIVVIVALIVWLRRDRTYPGPRLHSGDEGIDREELERAEREVRDLRSEQRPDEELPGDDWGPGAARPH